MKYYYFFLYQLKKELLKLQEKFEKDRKKSIFLILVFHMKSMRKLLMLEKRKKKNY